MRKSDIVRIIAQEMNLPQSKVRTIVDGIFLAISEALAKGEKIEIRGLGTMKIKRKPSRFIRDPRTGAEIFVKERYVPTFKMGKVMKNSINNREG